MKRVLVASLMAFGITTAAYAATEDKWFVTVDTVGNCSVAQGKPSEGQKALGEAGGYASKEEARSYLDTIRGDQDQCKGVVG
jgi:hypothetical protein